MIFSSKKKARIACFLIMCIIFSMVTGCGKEEEEAYSSPSFSNSHQETSEEEEATITDATLTNALMAASYTDAYPINPEVEGVFSASMTDAFPAGMYYENVYYNGLAGFKISVDGENWRFYDAAEMASATDTTEDYVNNLWYGYKSVYDQETTYVCIASNKHTGSNIIVSYVNPAKYMMPEYTAKEYLSMMIDRYDGVSVRTVTFLGEKYACLDIPADQTAFGRRTQFAMDKDGLIIIITFTMNGDTPLDEAVGMLSPLYY
ncbi:MAG: hypothetical protein K6E10_11715 [Eubacterium sp.]|nr:hypothetical protein [Eubacterium sp.]